MRKTLAALLAVTFLGIAALPSSAEARWGWGWGGFGLGFGTGLALGAAPYYYGGYPYYGDYYYGGPYAYAGDCVMRRRWVYDGYGHRVLRWRRVCY